MATHAPELGVLIGYGVAETTLDQRRLAGSGLAVHDEHATAVVAALEVLGFGVSAEERLPIPAHIRIEEFERTARSLSRSVYFVEAQRVFETALDTHSGASEAAAAASSSSAKNPRKPDSR